MALQKKTVLLLLLVVAALLAVVKFVIKPFSEQGTREAAPKPSMDRTQPEAMMQAEPDAQDGTVMEAADAMPGVAAINMSYSNPGGSDEVGFTLTVDQGGVITKAETSVLAKNPTSVKRQESFAAALPAVVVGKKISELGDIDRVGGSSLTTKAFNEALPALKAQL